MSMRRIGEILRTAREEKGYTIEDVARETNIARKYIIALEEENFSIFPAEAYILGFLKNYGEFLDLDIKELQNIYRVFKIQEQPVPVSELLKKPPALHTNIVPAAIAAVIIAIIAFGVFFILNMRSSPSKKPVIRQPEEYALNDALLEHRFFTGDSIIIGAGGEQYKITLVNLGETITLNSPDGNIYLNLNDDAIIDINEDGIPDLRISAVDYEEGNSGSGAYMRFELNNAAVGGGEGRGQIPPAQDMQTAAPESQETKSAAQDIIWSSGNTFPFTLQISFQGYCMFRWETLREGGQKRNEDYFVRGRELNISAQNGVRIWASNAGTVKMTAVGGGRNVPVEIGSAGEVVVTDILWRRMEDGRWALAKVRLPN